MRAVAAVEFDDENPLRGLAIGDFEPTAPPEGWVPVRVRAASLNHHDVWSLRGVGLRREQLPMILGTDAAGVDPDGNEVVIHAVIGQTATADDGTRLDETLDPKRSLLSEKYSGTFAETVWVPRDNLVPKPRELSFEEAACLPTAWLTAYKMLFVRGEVRAGSRVLVQGATGGVASAAILLAVAAGAEVFATSRSPEKREIAAGWGARPLEPGARVPERVDVVIETVGPATWDHSVKSLRPGGRLVVSGSTSGADALLELRRVFFLQLQILGSTMGSRDEFRELLAFLVRHDLSPHIDSVRPLDEAREAFARMVSGSVVGKLVLVP